MILAMPCEEMRIPSIACTISVTFSRPSAATVAAPSTRRLAERAAAALAFTWLSVSSAEAETSSTDEDCTAELVASDCEAWLTCETVCAVCSSWTESERKTPLRLA